MNTVTRTLAGLAILLSMTLVNTVKADEIFFSVKNNQGVSFPGEVTQAGLEGKLQALKLEGEFIPKGGSVGDARGKQGGIHGPIKITKKLGAASPAFYRALSQGTTLKVILEFWRPSRSGKSGNSHRLTLNNALVTGIGGTGVVTVGAMLTMAAHLEGKACSSVDQFGMAQKGGAVTSHVRIAGAPEDIHAVRLGAGTADLLLGCDSLVAAGDLALDAVAPQRTRAVINDHRAITGQFTRNPDLDFPAADIVRRIQAAAGEPQVDVIEATRLATGLMGDSIATNLFMLGYAYQKGLVPVSASGIERAIELNAIAVESNLETFRWGRRAAIDLDAVRTVVDRAGAPAEMVTPDLSARIATEIDVLVEGVSDESEHLLEGLARLPAPHRVALDHDVRLRPHDAGGNQPLQHAAGKDESVRVVQVPPHVLGVHVHARHHAAYSLGHEVEQHAGVGERHAFAGLRARP